MGHLPHVHLEHIQTAIHVFSVLLELFAHFQNRVNLLTVPREPIHSVKGSHNAYHAQLAINVQVSRKLGSQASFENRLKMFSILFSKLLKFLFIDTLSKDPNACSAGTYSLEGQSVCSDCPEGHVCKGQKGYTICPGGTYAENNECKDCEPGNYCLGGIKNPCEPDTFSLSKASFCELCPAGFECTDSTYSQCASGQYSGLGETSCEDCPAGYFCPQGGDLKSDDVIVCPLGHYCEVRSAAPKVCPEFTYGGSVGLKAEAECSDCPPGYYCPEGMAGYPTSLNVCPPGHYCTGEHHKLLTWT